MRGTNVILRIAMTAAAVDLSIENAVERNDVDGAKVAEQVRTLMSASEHAGAARAHLETAKAREVNASDKVPAAIAPPAPAPRKRPSRKRPSARKVASTSGSKSSHSPRAAKRRRAR